jgi:hypothetical protein
MNFIPNPRWLDKSRTFEPPPRTSKILRAIRIQPMAARLELSTAGRNQEKEIDISKKSSGRWGARSRQEFRARAEEQGRIGEQFPDGFMALPFRSRTRMSGVSG